MAELSNASDVQREAVARLLKGQVVECSKDGGAKHALKTKFAITNNLVARVPATPELRDAREIVWYGWDSPLYQGFARL
ncbi:MAG TPA: hypothetical protein VMG12_29340, partial [Polyangiaceae bacterium]|nr:hypothetical protein [Polyangiaceae bacterium]